MSTGRWPSDTRPAMSDAARPASTPLATFDPTRVRFGPDGLVPAIVLDAITGEVLTLAYMNAESLGRTLVSGETWFWSRSRQALWHKGETSGHTQRVVSLALDCDQDALVVRVVPRGPACHRDTRSCWDADAGGALVALDDTLRRRKEALPEGSYTTRLYGDENLRMKKIGEEAVELVHAALTGADERLSEEAADVIYHVAVVLHARGLSLRDALGVLEARRRG